MQYLNHTNVSEIVCTLLADDTVVGGAVGYLLGCYRRLIEKENSVADKVREDLAECRTQVVTFLASSLCEQEMFGANSERAVEDFHQCLGEERSPWVGGLLRLLTEELVAQDCLTQVSGGGWWV